MNSAIYVRGLAKLKRKLKTADKKFAASLAISIRTLDRIADGRAVSEALACRLKQKATRKGWVNPIFFEKPIYTLQLSLDPKCRRYARLDYIPRRNLVSAEALRQAISGRAFTLTFAKKLTRFFLHIPLEPREYSFVQLHSRSVGNHVEEWRARISSVGEGDELSDLTIILREKLKSYMELPERMIQKVIDRGAKFGAAEVMRLDLPKSTVQTLSNVEQNLLIAFGAAANELAFLTRLVTVASHQRHKGRMYKAYALSQQLTALKLFAGKIYECWKLVRLRFFNSKLSKAYVPLIPAHSKDALRELKKYFARSKNIVGLIRNEAAFHYSRTDLYPALARMPGEASYTAYLAGRRYYNELFEFCELAMAGHLLDQIHHDHYRAIRTIQNDVADIGSKMLLLLGGVAFQLIVEAQRRSTEKGRVVIRSMPLERKSDNHSIPIFIHPHDYSGEFFGLSRALKQQQKRLSNWTV